MTYLKNSTPKTNRHCARFPSFLLTAISKTTCVYEITDKSNDIFLCTGDLENQYALYLLKGDPSVSSAGFPWDSAAFLKMESWYRPRTFSPANTSSGELILCNGRSNQQTNTYRLGKQTRRHGIDLPTRRNGIREMWGRWDILTSWSQNLPGKK